MAVNVEIAKAIRDPFCTACKLSRGLEESSVCVTGEGPSKAKMMVVTKVPLGKRARTELGAYLEAAGIDPEQVYITSVNKCRVWDTTSTKTDQKTCKGLYLDKEIAMVKPSWILALGTEALYATTGKSGIMKYRGEVFAHASGANVVATIAPSMVNRNPGQKGGFEADLRYFLRMSKGEDVEDALIPPKMKNVTTREGLKLLIEDLKTCEGFAYDIETNGFEEYEDTSLMVSLSFTTWDKGATGPQRIWTVPLYHDESPWRKKWRWVVEIIAKYFNRAKRRIAHNGKFDLRWTRQISRCFDLTLTFDTMLAAHLLNENRPKGAKPLARELFGVEPWGIDTSDLLNEPLRPTLRYNGLDTWYTAHLYFKLRSQLMEQPRLAKLMQRWMVPASNVFTGIEMKGIFTDRELLQTRAVVCKQELKSIDDQLLEYVPDRSEWPSNVKEVNFNASNFSRWFLFDHLGLPVLDRGKTKESGDEGDPSMREDLLETLQMNHPHPAIDLMLGRIKWNKFDTSFFTPYLEQIDDNDRIHTTFKVAGTVTGRLASGKGDADKVTSKAQNRGVNLQQVPRDEFVRGLFGAPPDHAFIECDYSQVELRVAAFLAREKTMLDLYAANEDIHMAMAMRMTGKPAHLVTKEERKKAKAVNFGFLYGMGAAGFVVAAWKNYGVVVTLDEAKAFRKAFFDQFPMLVKWHAHQKAMARKYGRVESPIGRIRHLPDVYSRHNDVKAEAERQAINSPVQSFASDMAILALIELDREFKERGLETFSVGTVHDAINFQAPIRELPVVVPLIKHTMENLPLEEWFDVHLDVPIVGDVKIGTRWGGALEVEGDVVTDPDRLNTWLLENNYAA